MNGSHPLQYRSRRTLAAWLTAFASVLLLGAGVSASAQAAPSAAEQGLLAAESQRFADQVSRDATALAREIADEAVYGHVSGMHQSKAEYLHAVQGGGIPYRSIDASARTAHIVGTLGITRGVLRMQVGDSEKFSTYLGVYVRRDGRWQLLEWQSAQDPQHPDPGSGAPGKPPGSPASAPAATEAGAPRGG